MSARTFATAAPGEVQPLRPFSWHSARLDGNAHAEFLSLAKTVLSGVATCITIAQQESLSRDNNEATYLNESDAASLLLLAQASVVLLEARVDVDLDSLELMAKKAAK